MRIANGGLIVGPQYNVVNYNRDIEMEDEIDEIEGVRNAMIKCYRQFPTIVLGSGASIAYGLPSMPHLSDYILKKINTTNDLEKENWKKIKTILEKEKDIELVLNNIEIITSDTLLDKIRELIWDAINEKDMIVMQRAAAGEVDFELSKLLSGMFQSSCRKAHIITTNYDRIVEYACNSTGILYQAAFPPGHLQKWKNPEGIRYAIGNDNALRPARVVKIHKVHGSLDWFTGPDNAPMCLPFRPPSDNFSPLILIPGVRKFQHSHDEPFRSIMGSANSALRKARSLLCVGFGFRDQHVHPALEEACRDKNIPVIVLARELSAGCKEFLTKNAGACYMGIEECSSNGSKIYTPDNPYGIPVSKPDLWSLTGFCDIVL